MGSDASARFGPSPLQVVRFLPLLASSWLWLDALACTLSFYLTSLGSQCFLVLGRALPLVLRAVLLVFACAFLLYNLLSLSGGRSLCFLHLLCWHRVLCFCICSFACLISFTLSSSGLDVGLTSRLSAVGVAELS